MNTVGRTVRFQLIVWLAFSHLVAALAAVGSLYMSLASSPAPTVLHLVAAVLFGLVAGLLLSLPLRDALQTAEAALARLAQGQAIAPLPSNWRHRWGPLARLLTLVDALGGRERDLAGLREDLVRSTGEAAAQAERNRLARELHDSIKQQLYAINVSAAAALARWETDLAGARAAVEDLRRAAQAALAEMAALLQQLRPAPLAAAGLLDALAEQCEALAHRTGAHVVVDLGSPDDAATYAAAVDAGRLGPGAEEAIFRISQEALNNIARHARAAHAVLRVRIDEPLLVVEIEDDGQGFAPGETGNGTYGLAGMRDRAAAIGAVLQVDSAPRAGTRVRLVVPLGRPAAEEQSTMNTQMRSLVQRAGTWHSVAIAATLVALAVAQRIAVLWTGGAALQDSIAAALIGGGFLLILAVGGAIAWRQMRKTTLEVAVSLGVHHPLASQLRRDTYTRQLWAFMAGVLILPAAWMPYGLPQHPVISLSIGAACAMLAVTRLIAVLRANKDYWRSLSETARLAELAEAWRQRYNLLLVIGVTVPAYLWLLFGGQPSVLTWPPSRELMIDILATVYVILLIAWAVSSYVQIRKWQGRADGNQGA